MALLQQVAMENLIQKLWLCLPSQEYEAKNVIHRIVSHLSGLTAEEEDVSLHLLFQEGKGLKCFLDAVSNSNMKKVSIDVLEFLNYLVESHSLSLENYVVNIKNIAMSYVQRTSSSADEKDRALEILGKLVQNGPWNGDLQITYIVTHLHSIASHLHSKPRVLRQVYKLVGLLAEYLPQDINFLSKRLLNAMLLDLEYQIFTSAKVEFTIIEGCFNGLTGYLRSFPLDSSTESERCAKIAECIWKVLKLTDIHRKTAGRAALNLIANHGDQFETSLVLEFKDWHQTICNWLEFSKEDRIVGKQALLTFYNVIANYIYHQGGPKKTLDFFCNYFKKQFQMSLNIDIAVKGFGLFAKPLKVHSPEEIPAIFNIVAQKSREDSSKSNHHRLADYLDALSMFSAEAGLVHSLQLSILQSLAVQLICRYAEEEHPAWQRVMVDAVICTVLRLGKCGAAVDSFLNVVVHQGIIRSVSHPVVEDADILRETSQNKVVTYKNYVEFWQILITLETSRGNLQKGASIDQKRSVAREIVKKILNSVQDLINRLDLSLEENKSAESIYHCNIEKCMEATTPQDFTVLVNLVNFTIDLLNGLPDQSLLDNWLTPLLLFCINLSSKNPLVSSFYKLLASIVAIAEKLDYFDQEKDEMEDAEWRPTVNLLSGFLYDVISRQAQYRSDLQVSCLRLMLATPSCIALPLLRICVPAFQSVFQIGSSMLSLAHEGLKTLSRWNQDLPGDKMKILLKAVLPLFDSLLQTRDNVPVDENEDSNLYGMTLVRTVLQDKKKKKLWKYKANTQIDTELDQLQKEVVVFLSSLDSSSYLCLLDGSEDRVGVIAWQKDRFLKFPMPFTDMKVDISLDDLLPRLVHLAVNCSDRQTKTAACESLHAVIMFMLGKEKQLETAHQGHLTSLWNQLFPIIFRLACDVDLIVNQLFKPLGEQLAHWYSSKMNEGSQQADAFLRAILDGITHQTDAALRDYSATCLHEYVEWSRKQGNMMAKVAPVIKFVLSLCQHPCPQKRIGASLAFNSMYTVLREDLNIVDEYWIELLYGFVTGLSLCSITGEEKSTEGQIDKSLQHILRVLLTYSNKFNLDSPSRRVHKEIGGKKLWHALRWLLKYCTALNTQCRHSCMKLVNSLASKVSNCRSTRDFIDSVVSTESINSLLLIAEGESGLHPSLPNTAWDQALAWVCSLLASMESYLWLIEVNAAPASLFALNNSKIIQALMHFLESILHSPVNKTSLWRPKAMEHFNNAKCTTIVRIIDFFTAVLDCGQGFILSSFWTANFWQFLIKVCLWPSNLGFDSTSKSVGENLPITVQKFLRSLISHAPASALSEFKRSLMEYTSTVVPGLLHKFQEAVRHDRAVTHDKELVRGLTVLQNVFEETQMWSSLSGEKSLITVFQAIVEPVLGSEHFAPVCLNPAALLYAQSMLEFYFSTRPELNHVMISILDKTALCQRDLQCNITHGEHFVACFETLLVQRLLEVPQQSIDALVEYLSSDVSPQHLTILPAVLKCRYSVNSTIWSLQRQLVDCLFLKWNKFVVWAETDHFKEAWLISLLNRIVELNFDFHAFKNISYINSWILELLTSASRALSLKTDLLYCLPIVCSISEASDVKQSLLTLKNQHFPAFCSEFKQGTEELSSFKRAYEALLQSLIITGNSSILHIVIRTISVDPNHSCRKLLPSTLEKYMAQLQSSQGRQVESLKDVFSMFDNETIAIDYRKCILNEFLLKMMTFASLPSQISFSVSIINKLLKKITGDLSTKTDVSRQKQKLMSLIGSWQLLQLIYGFPMRSLLEEKGSELVQAAFLGSGKEIVTGKELYTLVVKTGLEAFQNPLNIAVSDAKELYRQYLCAIYNTLATLFCNLKNQPSDLKFYKVLFSENSRKFWRLLVDEEKCYMLPYEKTEHLKSVEKIVTIRRNVSEDKDSSQISLKSLQLLHSPSLAGSLETDITRFDFTYSRVIKSTNHEAHYDRSVILLENDLLNDHECMPTVCSLIRHLVDCGISPTPALGTLQTVPDWMDSFKNSLLDTSNPRNCQIFILRVILNCEAYFSAYAVEWIGPILDCTLRVCLQNGISYLLGDVVCMLAKWTALHKSLILNKSQLNILFSYLVQHCPNLDRTVLRYHLELIKTMLEVWKQFIDPPHDMLMNMLDNPDVRVGINLTAIMLFHELTPWTLQSKKSFILFLQKNLNNNAKEVFKASGGTLGMCFRHLCLQNDGLLPIDDQKFVDDLEDILKHVNVIKHDCDRFLVLLDSVSESYPPVLDNFMPNILLYLNQTGGNWKAPCLNLLLKRLGKVGVNPYQELKGCGLLTLLGDQKSEVQVKVLQILCQLAPTLQETELQEVVHEVSFITPYVKGEARNLVHEISLIAFDRYLPLHESDNLSDIGRKCFDESKALLLLGLVDSNADLQKKCLSKWTEEERLPQNVANRLTTIFSLLYSPLTEQYFLSYSVPLVLAGSKTTVDFNSALFSHALDDCEFGDMHLLTSWRVKNAHMAPLYAKTLSSQLTLHDASNSLDSSYPLLATQNSLVFQPTADFPDGSEHNSPTKPKSSLLKSSFLFSQDISQNSKPGIRGNFKQGSEFGSHRLHLTEPSEHEDNVTRGGFTRASQYIGRKTAGNVYSKANVRRAKKREELWKERKLRREGQVSMHRKYRLGDLPDIQIKFSDVINPLSELSKHDSIIARKIMVSLFIGVKEVTDTLDVSNNFKHVTSALLTQVLKQSNKSNNFEPSTIGACLEIAYNCQLSLDSHLVTEVAAGSNLLALGVLLLEAAALDFPGDENIWLDLSQLYDGLGERDIAHSILLQNIPLDNTAKAALEAHAEEQWQKAKTLYVNSLKETKYDNFYESCFECMAILSDWEKINEVIRDEVDNDLNNLWDSGWNEKKLLPRLLHSEVLGLVQANEDKNKFLNVINKWLKDDGKSATLNSCFSAEMSIICLEKKKFPESRFYGSKTLSKFIDDWNELNPLFRKRREIMLLGIQSITDVMVFFLGGKELQSIEDCQKFLKHLEKVTPVPQDSLMHWETRIAYRMACMKYMPFEIQQEVKASALKMQLSLVEAALQQGNQNFAKKYILDMKGKIDSSNPALKTRWLIARCSERHQWSRKEKNCVIRLDYLIQVWKQLDQVLMSSDLKNHPELSVIAYSVESNLASTIKETISAEPSSINVLRGKGDSYEWLGTKLQIEASVLCEEAESKLETLGLSSLLHSKNIAKEYKNTPTYVTEHTGEAYLKIAQYCRKLLEHQGDSTSTSTATLERYLVMSILSAMKCGSNQARQLFPILLQLPTLPSTLSKEFVGKSSSIPVWMFLGWIPQLLAMLDSSAASLVAPLLLKIAETYPNAISYPYNISKEKCNISSSKLAVIKKLDSMLANSSHEIELTRALSCLTYPSIILKDYINKMTEVVETTSIINWASLKEICEEFSHIYGDEYNPSKFTGKFFDSYKKHGIHALFKKLYGAINNENAKVAKEIVKALKEKIEDVRKLDLKSIKPYSKLKDFSPWLSNFSSSKSNVFMEIPGQYTGNQKPNPERHAMISGFNDTVLVMSSIRRPVKLTIIGSDAQSHNFLVKYGEDLRQDERVQQLLDLMNSIFSNNHLCRDRHLSVITYRVMPLSTRLGIIEWVDKTQCLKDVMMSPLPGSDQEKDGLLNNLRLEQSSWFLKSLKAQGAKAYGEAHMLISREASIAQFHKLVSSTKLDILRKALQIWSSSAEAFYWLRHSFITSYSTLCIAHWLLGVGDRHLQNCLVSQSSGQCIGIDFGHVFGTATLNLPVPELVPFRLTPHIVEVAQPHGTKGLFQETMTNALRALQADHEILLATMQVFIQEPSLDWLLLAKKHLSQSEENQHPLWLPVVKIQQARKKLDGYNPVCLMREDLDSKTHALFKDGYLKTLKGEPHHNIRARLPDTDLTPRQQVECLIDLATDPNVLVKTWGGWDPWM